MRRSLILAALVLALGKMIAPAYALEEIVRPYQSVRSSGMGNVRITTGLYDENFFGNPARATANPEWRITLLDPMFETGTGTINSMGDLTSSSGDSASKLGHTAGNDNHGRFQSTMPAVYSPHIFNSENWAFAFAFIQSLQFDVALRNSYQVSPQTLWDVGPAITVARRFKVKGEELAVGVTPHLTYRISSPANYSFSDLIAGKSLSPLQSGGDGTMIDFDLGTTYNLPWKPSQWTFGLGFAINNLLGGNYKNVSYHNINTGNGAQQQPRDFGIGVSAHRDELWKFTNAIFALEATDVGNNANGGTFRLIHLGGEAHWHALIARLGINQGYFCAGFGLDIKHFELDLSTYGEELSLNAGQLEDRRFAMRFSIHI